MTDPEYGTWPSLIAMFFAQAKAAYLLMLAGPLALAFATGFAGLDAWLAERDVWPARAVLYGWLALFVGTLFLGFAR